MHLLTRTVNRSVSAGILVGGLVLALLVWFLSYTQAKVDAFSDFGGTGQYIEQ